MRIAYFGGSFNPPHYSHFLAAAWALFGGYVDRVWMVPCYQHAFGKELAPFADRMAMCELGARPFSERLFVSDIEKQLGGPAYTIEVIDHLVDTHPDVSFRLLVGSDILHEKNKWKEFDRLVTLSPLLVAPRGGVDTQSAFQIPQMASTLLRDRLLAGEDVSDAMPPDVYAYLREHQLYIP
jgi:nicotinate-nucleotide adenylyltransferase